ncbi:RTA1 like protein-domain-containing protein [Xylariomycetidae sp. FL2044]|nr:RTA1 like protein-domain-containing protein [Xylariomycetidae sp. FL2044]
MTKRPLSLCTLELCWPERSLYGYRPSIAASLIFLLLFLISLLSCLVFTIPKRRWLAFSIPVSVACVLEILGYGVRLASYFDPYLWDARLFAVSTTALTIAPAFVSTGIYFTVSETVTIIGADHSLIRPKNYPHLVWIDVAGFVLQVAGVAVTFSDLSLDTGLGTNATPGSLVICAGTALQALSLLCFLMLFGVIVYKAKLEHRRFGYTSWHPERGFVALTQRFKIFVSMLVVAIICLFTRAVYRTMLLGMGLQSTMAQNEMLFAGLEGFLVVVAVVSLVVAHPASYLEDGLMEKLRNISVSPPRTPVMDGNVPQANESTPERRQVASPWNFI